MKVPNLRCLSKGGIEPGISQLSVQHSTAELPCSTNTQIVEYIMTAQIKVIRQIAYTQHGQHYTLILTTVVKRAIKAKVTSQL